MASDEWSEWRAHDGKHAPIGFYLQVKFHSGMSGEGYLDDSAINPARGFRSRWIYDELFPEAAVRYRIRTPRGLTILREILREVEHDKQPEYNAH